MTEPIQPKQVVAKFNFKGKNNDELCFNKKDVITVTQAIDGGWWEGTLNDITGWFPSNYVKEQKLDSLSVSSQKSTVGPKEIVISNQDSLIKYHQLVLDDVIVSERQYLADLTNLLQLSLRPLQSSGFLSSIEYHHLIGNLEQLLPFQQEFLQGLEECAKLPHSQQKAGGYFIKIAPQLKSIYETYWSNHPWAVELLQNKKADFEMYLETKGLTGFMQFTSSLSQPFLRLDKYCNLLKELERHIEDSHPDRGDTQRAVCVYKDIMISCTETRKLKEMEYNVLHGTIQNWEGEEISKIGEVVLFSQVRLLSADGDKKECIFVLFSSTLVMLSVSPRMSGYLFEGRLPVLGMTVQMLEDKDTVLHAIELTGATFDKKVMLCGSSQKQRQWCNTLKMSNRPPPPQQSSSIKHNSCVLTQPSLQNTSTQGSKTGHMSYQDPLSSSITSTTSSSVSKTWMMSCLRPSAPLRPTFMHKDDPSKSPRTVRKATSIRRKHDDMKANEDDAMILRVIENYCTSARARHTINSSLLDCPSLLIAEDEKIIMDNMEEEKSLVDTVYLLKDEMKQLQKDSKRLRRDLDLEVGARKKLEQVIRKSKLMNTISSLDQGGQGGGRDLPG